MSKHCYQGKINLEHSLCNLSLTLLGGQSFRWEKCQESLPAESIAQYRGVAFNTFWILTQQTDTLCFKAVPANGCFLTKNHNEYFVEILQRYFRLDFDLTGHINKWKAAHRHFDSIISNNLKAVRVLNQEPFENILSFICSQNNNIKRISSMIQWLCATYGEHICQDEGDDFYTFPSLDAMVNCNDKLESKLRDAKFGYRAKFISETVKTIHARGGEKWLRSLCDLPYEEARAELISLPGIGPKVADCICLMSLSHLESVPIDTHIYKIAKTSYLPELKNVKNITPAIYMKISKHFRNVYGTYAGWAQAVLFCSDLGKFSEYTKENSNPPNQNKIKIEEKQLITTKCKKKRV